MTANLPNLPGRALCAETDPEAFFPELGANEGTVAEAVAVCRKCPVLPPCLAWAVKHEKHGVWGGTTPNQRKALRRPERAA